MRVWNVCPEEPLFIATDPSRRLSELALAGYPQLAADSILNKENQGKVLSIIEDSIVQLDQSFNERNASSRKKCVEVLLEIALNFLGMERKCAGFSDVETSEVLDKVTRTLQKWERTEDGESVRAVIEQMLGGMKMVLSGKGMVANMAEEIERTLVGDDLAHQLH